MNRKDVALPEDHCNSACASFFVRLLLIHDMYVVLRLYMSVSSAWFDLLLLQFRQEATDHVIIHVLTQPAVIVLQLSYKCTHKSQMR